MGKSASFDRRRFLELAGVGLATSALTPWMSGCEVSRDAAAAPGRCPSDIDNPSIPDTPLGSAWKRARSRGSPLLIMLADPKKVGHYSLRWSAYLDCASDAAQAELALCELAFAIPEQVRAIWNDQLDERATIPFGLVIEPPRGVVQRVAAADSEPSERDFYYLPNVANLRPWIAEMERALHAAIAPDEATFERAAKAVLGEKAGSRRACEAALARLSRERNAKTVPAGARWARRFGACASVEFEDGTKQSTHPGAGVACGMGSISNETRHFLWMYTGNRH